MGNILESVEFTVTVYETVTYTVYIAGKNATGKITVKNRCKLVVGRFISYT